MAKDQGIATRAEIDRTDVDTRRHRLHEIGRAHGFFRQLSDRHSALFVEESDVLVVSFDTLERVLSQSGDGLPLGFEAVEDEQVSLLSIMGTRQGWFRDNALYAFFDELIDDGFFDRFDRVLFVGIGPMCGYGALAYSVAAPFSRVLAVSPAATLDRRAAPFEQRYRSAWKLDFTDRYGYAPMMAEAAEMVTVIYDPADPMSAAHAALFDSTNVSRFTLRHGGLEIGPMLEEADLLWPMAVMGLRGQISPALFARMSREARRAHAPYVSNLIDRAEQAGHAGLALRAARFGKAHINARTFDEAVTRLTPKPPPQV